MSLPQVDAYPLQWPEGWPRTPKHKRKWGSFSEKTRAKAVTELMWEIERLGGRRPVLSSMLKVRQDGLPYSQQPRTDDPGVAVYFTYKDRQMCFAADSYLKDVDNIWAIKLTIEALRGIQRWGASDMMDRAFTGFQALPMRSPWYKVLGVSFDATRQEIDSAYRSLARSKHPDTGGSNEEMAELNVAYDDAKLAVEQRGEK